MKQFKFLLATLVASILLYAFGVYANQTNPSESNNSCSAILRDSAKKPSVLPEIRLIASALQHHVSVNEITPQITQRAIENFLDIIDPLHVTLTAEERNQFSHLSEQDLTLVQNQLLVSQDRSFFDTIASLALKRLNILNTEFSTNKEFRDQVFARIKDQPNRRDQAAPETTDQIEGKYLDLFAWWTKYFESAGYALFARLPKKLSQQEAFILSIRCIRREVIGFALTLRTEGMPLLIAKAFIGALDPHSRLELPSEAASGQRSMSGQMVGIGISASETVSGLQVNQVMPGAPADKAGLVAGDVITHVADANLPKKNSGKWWLLRAMSQHMNEMIDGPEGSKLNVRIRRGNEIVEKTLIREQISLADSKIQIEVVPSPQGKIARVQFDLFYNGVGDQLRHALEETLKQNNISAVVLDLRGNPGGSANEIGSVLGLFVRSGPAVQIASRDSTGKTDVNVLSIPADNVPVWNGPLVVMTDDYAASASEALAGALKDYQRAVIVGDKATFGKGSAQTGLNLRSHGLMWLTMNMFYTPSGKSPQKVGIASDIVLPRGESEHRRERELPGVIEPFAIPPAPGFAESVAASKGTFIPVIKSTIVSLKKMVMGRLSELTSTGTKRAGSSVELQYKQNTKESERIAADLAELLLQNHAVTRVKRVQK